MFLGLLTLLTSLTISSVAVYYSVSGLAAIFAGAYYPIIIMGASLEIGKLVTASWLHKNWKTAPKILKSYLVISVIVLMIITSLGIFGFLSRAHIEQGAPIGDVSAQIELLDEKIAARRTEIEQSRSALKNLDDVVAQYLAKGKDERSVAAANNARKGQQAERNKTSKIIDDAQKEISKLQEQKLPLTKQVRQIETEVGPIKYIAAFMYGNNPGQDLLEKSVTWMILTIIFVFDPLAVLLLIASQISFAQRKKKKEDSDPAPIEIEKIIEVEKIVEVEKPIDRIVVEYQTIEIEKIVEKPVEVEVIKTVTIERPVEVIVEKIIEKIVEVEKQVEVIVEKIVEVERILEVEKIVEVERPAFPTIIKTMLDPTPTISTTTVIVNSEESDPIEYVQNSEQSANSIWKKIQSSRGLKPMDVLYKEYSEHGFNDIDLTGQDLNDPEIQILINYVQDVKDGNIHFDDIPYEHREKLANLITKNN